MQLTVVQTPITPDGKQSFGMDILEVIWTEPNEPLSAFSGELFQPPSLSSP